LKTRVFLIFLSLALLTALWPAVVRAADSQSGREGADIRSYRLPPVVVNAQKLDEDVQKVPVSMSVFTDLMLENIGAETVSDLINLTPNVYLAPTRTENTMIFRGISSFDTAVYAPSALYVDGVSFPILYMHNPDLFDLERVEILRGPQGTLYGRNSESGLVNIITRQPDETFRARLYSGYGSYNSYNLGGSVSGPILADRLFAGLALDYRTSDGYMENRFQDDDRAASMSHLNGRFTLRFKPTPVWDASLILDAFRTNDGNGLFRYVTGPSKTDYNVINQDGDLYARQNGSGQTIRVGYQGSLADFLSITGVRYFKNDAAYDNDFTPVPLVTAAFVNENRYLSQEFRWSSPKNAGYPLKWLFGFYGFSEWTGVDYEQNGAGFLAFLTTHAILDTKVRGLAVFGQSTYTLMDRLHMTAGLRYEDTTLSGELNNSVADLHFEKDLKNRELLPKVAISYDLSEAAMVYGSVSWGYLAGGFNYYGPQSPDDFPYDPEHTTNYEIGLKTAWWDNRVQANFALFYIDIRDKQVFLTNPFTDATRIENAARAHTDGAEIELRARPLPGLEVSAGVGYTEALFDRYRTLDPTTLSPVDYSGNHLPSGPAYTYNFGVEYHHPTGFFGRTDMRGVGRFYANPANSAYEEPYTVVNLRLGYETRRVEVVFWVENLLNEEYEIIKHAFGISELAVDGAPRAAGVTVTLRY
jgi:iron complex outermembrane receptor protein